MAKKVISFSDRFSIPSGTSQQRGIRGRRTHPKESLKIARAEWKAFLERHAPKVPVGGALSLNIIFAYATKDKRKWGCPKTTRPDTTNLVKIAEDAMTACGYWGDDSQVAETYAARVWDETGWVKVEVSVLEEKWNSSH